MKKKKSKVQFPTTPTPTPPKPIDYKVLALALSAAFSEKGRHLSDLINSLEELKDWCKEAIAGPFTNEFGDLVDPTDKDYSARRAQLDYLIKLEGAMTRTSHSYEALSELNRLAKTWGFNHWWDLQMALTGTKKAKS